MSTARQTAALDALAKLLRKGPLTARQIANVTRCCKPAAYSRVRALELRGERVYTVRVANPTRSGPEPLAYGIR